MKEKIAKYLAIATIIYAIIAIMASCKQQHQPAQYVPKRKNPIEDTLQQLHDKSIVLETLDSALTIDQDKIETQIKIIKKSYENRPTYSNSDSAFIVRYFADSLQ